MTYVPVNKKGNRLKDCIKYLEVYNDPSNILIEYSHQKSVECSMEFLLFYFYLQDQLRDNSIIYCQWYSDRIAQLMFSNGLLVHIQIYPLSGDIEKINFDKYLVGKLSEHASDGNFIIYSPYLLRTKDDLSLTWNFHSNNYQESHSLYIQR